jgi:hypothetical protein
MYKTSLTDDEQENIANSCKFERKVSEKPYEDFFREKVISCTGRFHEALEQRARNPEKSKEPLGGTMITGLKSIAKSICRDSETCQELNALLGALVKNGSISESEKDKARLTFVLAFIGNHASDH